MDTADTRTRIVLTAMQLFWEKGFGSTSVADILHTANVNSGSLYHFFPSKQDVLLAVLEMYHGGIGPLLLEPACGSRDRLDWVLKVMTSLDPTPNNRCR